MKIRSNSELDPTQQEAVEEDAEDDAEELAALHEGARLVVDHRALGLLVRLGLRVARAAERDEVAYQAMFFLAFFLNRFFLSCSLCFLGVCSISVLQLSPRACFKTVFHHYWDVKEKKHRNWLFLT